MAALAILSAIGAAYERQQTMVMLLEGSVAMQLSCLRYASNTCLRDVARELQCTAVRALSVCSEMVDEA